MKTPDLGDHQAKAVKELSNGKILVGGVGLGKSRVAAAYAMANEVGRDIYVVTTAKKRDSFDWQDEFFLWGAYERLTVLSWNELPKFRNVHGAFFIFDEQRVVGSGAWVKAFLDLARKNHWILLSATPGDTWLDYVPVFVANGFYKNRSEFKQRHCVYTYWGRYPQLERYVEVGKLVKLRNALLVDMPYERHTIRHEHIVECEYDKEALQKCLKLRWNVLEDTPLKDAGDLHRVSRQVVNSDSTRVAAILSLLQTHPRLIVFYNFDYELELLRDMIRGISMQCDQITSARSSMKSPVLENSSKQNSDPSQTINGNDSKSSFKSGEWNGHRHDLLPDGNRWIYLVQYTAGSEGWNCIVTDTMVMYSLPYSYKQWSQAFGRIDRMNTPYTDLHYYILRSKSWIDARISRSLANKESFNEAKSGVQW